MPVLNMLNIRRSRDRLIFNMGIHIPGKNGIYIETGPMVSRELIIPHTPLIPLASVVFASVVGQPTPYGARLWFQQASIKRTCHSTWPQSRHIGDLSNPRDKHTGNKKPILLFVWMFHNNRITWIYHISTKNCTKVREIMGCFCRMNARKTKIRNIYNYNVANFMHFHFF